MPVIVTKRAQKDCKGQSKNKKLREKLADSLERFKGAAPVTTSPEFEAKGFCTIPEFRHERLWTFCPLGKGKPERVVFVWNEHESEQFVLRIFSKHDYYDRFLDNNSRRDLPPKQR